MTSQTYSLDANLCLLRLYQVCIWTIFPALVYCYQFSHPAICRYVCIYSYTHRSIFTSLVSQRRIDLKFWSINYLMIDEREGEKIVELLHLRVGLSLWNPEMGIMKIRWAPKDNCRPTPISLRLPHGWMKICCSPDSPTMAGCTGNQVLGRSPVCIHLLSFRVADWI